MADTRTLWAARVSRFVVALLILAAIFALVEVLPLHYGRSGLPWEEVWPVVGSKLPRMVLIGLGVAVVLAFGRPQKREDGEESEQGQTH